MTIRVTVLAQDLIWADRLARAVQAAGAEAVRAGSAPDFERALVGADAAIIDVTASAYDPLVAIEHARSADTPVLVVGPHDDVPARKEALARGADRVLAYRKLFEDGPATIGTWLARVVPNGAATP